VTVGGFTKTSNASGYSDFTAEPIGAEKGQSLALRLRPGYSGSSYSEAWRVWADWNRDGDFDDAGEQVLAKSGCGELSGTIAIPASAVGGATRMRVSMGYGSYPNACGGFTYGEVEDYTLDIH
jgi:hypothetical protein